MAEYNADLDFNFEEDAKLPGLVPGGTYHGSITSAMFDPERACIVWQVTLNDNGGMCTDDETPIDGMVLEYRNWLPKVGDEDIMTASGKMNKRQAKINMMAEFIKRMQFEQSTVAEVIAAIEDAEYVGTDVELIIGQREYQGSVFNDIQKMYTTE